MSDRDDHFSSSTSLGNQADEIIDEDTTWVELAEQLDVSLYKQDDPYLDWHDSTPFEAIILLYRWATVESESLTGIPDRLEDNPELAEAVGLDPDDLPSPSTFKPSRMRDKRLTNIQSTLDRAAEEIRNLSAERGAPIGYSLTYSEANEDDDPEPTKRTINRMLRRKSKEVLQETKDVAIPAISLPRSDEAIYDSDELLVLEALAAIKRMAANQGGEKLGDKKNPDGDDGEDVPFYEDGPSGETLLDAIKEMSVDSISRMLNFALRKTYTRAKPKLGELDDYDKNVMVALDVTYVGYYGETDELEWVQGTPEKNEDEKPYDWCHMFATAVIVGENTHYTVAVRPLGSTEYADNNAYPGKKSQTYHVGNVARDLLSVASEFVDIRMVSADREFHAVDVLYTLEQHDVKYVIPAKQDEHRVGPKCDNFDELKNGFADDKRDQELYVEDDYPMHGPVKHKVSNEKIRTNLVILPPDEDDETHSRDSPQPFLTNSEVNDELAMERRRAAKKINRYSNRAAIENSYTSIKKAGAWTTSKEFEVRWFHFAFGCIIYNMWLLVDFLTQDRIGVIETRTEPRIPLRRFLDKLEDAVMTLI